MTTVFSQPRSSFVNRNLNEPRAELGLGPKSRQVRESFKYGLLRDLFGIRRIIDDRHRGNVDRSLTWTDEAVERFLVAVASPPNEFGLARIRICRGRAHRLCYLFAR